MVIIFVYLFFQIDATLDAYIKPDVYEQIPMDPNNMVKTGKEVFLVSKQEGRIARVPGVDIIRGLASFRCVFLAFFSVVGVCVCVCLALVLLTPDPAVSGVAFPKGASYIAGSTPPRGGLAKM